MMKNTIGSTSRTGGRCAPLAVVVMALCACATGPGGSGAAGSSIVRHPNADPASVTSRAVETGPGAALVFLSGQTPEPVAPDAPRFSAAYWGDTETQTASTLAKLDRQLQSLGLTMADVVKLQVFLVADPPAPGNAESAGFERAYGRRFGRDASAAPANAPGRPARTVVQVAALGHPGVRVEIDAIAVRR